MKKKVKFGCFGPFSLWVCHSTSLLSLFLDSSHGWKWKIQTLTIRRDFLFGYYRIPFLRGHFICKHITGKKKNNKTEKSHAELTTTRRFVRFRASDSISRRTSWNVFSIFHLKSSTRSTLIIDAQRMSMIILWVGKFVVRWSWTFQYRKKWFPLLYLALGKQLSSAALDL